MLFFRFYVGLMLTISLGETANILGIFPLHVRSHYTVFESVLKHLAEKGHNVDVVTPFVAQNVPPGYNQISIEGNLPSLVNNFPMDLIRTFSHYNMIEFMIKIAGLQVCEATFKTLQLENLKKSKKKYDLVMTEIFGSDCMVGFSHVFNAPVVSIMSSVSLPWANDRIGNPDNPSYIPNYFMPAGDKMDIYERTLNTLRLIMSKVLYQYMSSKDSNSISKHFFGPNLPALEDITYNTSLILVNSHFSINYARPTVANFIEIGGIHIKQPKPLSDNFEKLLQTDSKGIIFLTMGSMIQTESFDFDVLQAMFDAFSQLPYKVVWKADREKFSEGLKIPNNIYFETWMPQLDILCHPNVKLFVAHGGLLGFQEAIYCGVPILGIPLFADQEHNIRNGERLGVAFEVGYKDISKKTIFEAAHQLLENPMFANNAKRISVQFKDRPMSPADTAVYWIEYVIRHKGAPHLRSAATDLAWYQYYLVDVAVILLFAFGLIILSVFLIIKLIVTFIYGLGKKQKK